MGRKAKGCEQIRFLGEIPYSHLAKEPKTLDGVLWVLARLQVIHERAELLFGADACTGTSRWGGHGWWYTRLGRWCHVEALHLSNSWRSRDGRWWWRRARHLESPWIARNRTDTFAGP